MSEQEHRFEMALVQAIVARTELRRPDDPDYLRRYWTTRYVEGIALAIGVASR